MAIGVNEFMVMSMIPAIVFSQVGCAPFLETLEGQTFQSLF